MDRKNVVRDWQDRLEENFSHNGMVGGKWLPIVFEQEHETGNELVSTYKGHRILIDSFMDFYAESLMSMVATLQKNSGPKNLTYYSVCLNMFLVLFRGFRASENLFVTGYPLDGFSLQRNLKDQILGLGAIANGFMSFSHLFGHYGLPEDRRWTNEDKDNSLKNRKKAERNIIKRMTGKNSGLSNNDVRELEKWHQIFHQQVHGSRFTFYGEAGQWMFQKAGKFSLGPRHDENSAAMYMNRAVEISWMILRVLPFIQTSSGNLGKDWEKKWIILDESFLFSVRSLERMDKKIAGSFINLINSKFNFDPKDSYKEIDADEIENLYSRK